MDYGNSSLDAVFHAQVGAVGKEKALQIEAAAALLLGALLEGNDVAGVMVICLAQGCGITDEDLGEIIRAAEVDVAQARAA